MKNNGAVFTLQEASKITGVKVSTLRMRIKSGRLEGFKKASKRGEKWVIKAESLKELEILEPDRLKVQKSAKMNPANLHPAKPQDENTKTLLLQAKDELAKTLQNQVKTYEVLLRDFQGRINILESDKLHLEYQIKLLPAPPEVVNEDLKKKEEALEASQKAIMKLQEELEIEKRKPWWKKIFGVK